MKSSGWARTDSIDILPASLTIGSLLSRPSQGDRMWLLRQRGGLKLSLGRNKRLIYGRLLLGSRRWRVCMRGVGELFFFFGKQNNRIRNYHKKITLRFIDPILRKSPSRWVRRALLPFNISKDASRSFSSSAGEPQVWMGAASSSGADPACVWSVEQIISCREHQSAVCPVKKVHICGQ